MWIDRRTLRDRHLGKSRMFTAQRAFWIALGTSFSLVWQSNWNEHALCCSTISSSARMHGQLTRSRRTEVDVPSCLALASSWNLGEITTVHMTVCFEQCCRDFHLCALLWNKMKSEHVLIWCSPTKHLIFRRVIRFADGVPAHTGRITWTSWLFCVDCLRRRLLDHYLSVTSVDKILNVNVCGWSLRCITFVAVVIFSVIVSRDNLRCYSNRCVELPYVHDCCGEESTRQLKSTSVKVSKVDGKSNLWNSRRCNQRTTKTHQLTFCRVNRLDDGTTAPGIRIARICWCLCLSSLRNANLGGDFARCTC